jgi:DNA gyrase subunit A
VTDRGQVIRIPVDGIRIAGRNTQGVTLFDVAEGEHVVSVARLVGAAEPPNGAEEAGEGDGGIDGDTAAGDEPEGEI